MFASKNTILPPFPGPSDSGLEGTPELVVISVNPGSGDFSSVTNVAPELNTATVDDVF